MRLRGGRGIAGRKAFVTGLVDQPFCMGGIGGAGMRRQFCAARFRHGRGFFDQRHDGGSGSDRGVFNLTPAGRRASRIAVVRGNAALQETGQDLAPAG